MATAGRARTVAVLLCLCQLEAAAAAAARKSFGIVRRLFIHPDMANSVATAPRIKIGTSITFGTIISENCWQNSYEMFFSTYVERYEGVLINGTRHAVELVLVDDSGTTSGAELAARYLVNEEGIKLFLGPNEKHQINNKVAEVVNAAGGVIVLPGTNWQRVFRGRAGVFGIQTTQRPEDGPLLATLGAAENHTNKTLTYLGNLNESQKQHLMDQAAANNINVTGVVPLQLLQQNSSWAEVMMQGAAVARRLRPDILMTSYLDDTQCEALLPLLRAFEERDGYRPKAVVLWGCPTMDSSTAARQHFTGIILASEWRRRLPFTGALTGAWTAAGFANEYKQRYGAEPPWGGAAAFVAAAALVRGIEGARSPTPWHVILALKAMRADSIFGNIRFDRYGQSTAPVPAMWCLGTQMDLVVPCVQCAAVIQYPKLTYAEMECSDPRWWHLSDYGYLDGVCIRCPPGRFSESWTSSKGLMRTCTLCPEGTYSATNLSRPWVVSEVMCIPCQPGSFANITGATLCTRCPPGRATNRSGQTACEPCSAGSQAESPGLARCRACMPGHYQNKTGQKICHRCALGFYRQGVEGTACDACPEGLTTRGTGFISRSACGCPAGSYDTVSSDGAATARPCRPCPEGISCKGFRAPLELVPGYYEAGGEIDPVRGVWKCPSERVCPGGAPGTCSGGLEGIACSLCPEGQANDGERCGNCHRANAAFPVLLCLGGPIFIIGFYYLATPDLMGKHTPVKLGSGIMLSVTVTVVQVLGMLFQLSIEWPEQVIPILQGCATMFGNGDVYAFPCVLGREPQNTYIFICIFPFVMAALFVLVALASRLLPVLTRRRLEAWSYLESVNALGGLGQVSFIILTAQAASAVQCYTHPNGRQTMLKYPSIICFEGGAHTLILCFGGLLLLCLVIPFMAMSLWGNYSAYVSALNEGVDAPQLIMYRFLFYRYRPMVWWWGSVFNARQLLLGLTPMVTPNDPGMQATIVQLILIIYLMLLLNFYPWRSLEINFLDAAITTFMCCIMIAASNLVPATTFRTRHWQILFASVVLTLITVAVAIIHTLVFLVRRGCSGEYGVRFPKEASLNRFTIAWTKLIRRLAKITDDSHLQMLEELDDFDRRSIDRVICIVSSMLDIEHRESWQLNRFRDWTPACKVLRTTAGSFQHVLCLNSNSRPLGTARSQGERVQREALAQGECSEQGEACAAGTVIQMTSEAAPQLLGRAEPREAEQCQQEPATPKEAPDAPAAAGAAECQELCRRTSELCQQLSSATSELMVCMDALGDATAPDGRVAVSQAFRVLAFLEQEIACKTQYNSL